MFDIFKKKDKDKDQKKGDLKLENVKEVKKEVED